MKQNKAIQPNNLPKLRDAKSNTTTANASIESMIIEIRGQQVMIDRDLAMLYDVETKALNQAVKRNIERFPDDFMFQLSKDECSRSQIVTLNRGRGQNLKYLPYAFTENGIAMLSSILKSPNAIAINIRIMRTFTLMRRMIASENPILHRMGQIECHQLELSLRQSETDKKLDEILQQMESGRITPQEGVFYDGQIFDAYAFASDLVRSAQRRIVLIDNYVDDSVLLTLSKRKKGVAAEIVTRRVTETLRLDLERHNRQYPPVSVRECDRYHDRFLLIDDTVYHLGASLKDLGKKLFAFSRMEVAADKVLGADASSVADAHSP